MTVAAAPRRRGPLARVRALLRRAPWNNWVWRRRWVIHPLAGAVVNVGFALLRPLPIDWISGLGGFLGRAVGPRMATPNRRALQNLAVAFPEKSEAERRAILRAMWDHLGRVATEYACLDRLLDADRVVITGAHHVARHYGQGRPILFIGGHVGHWELGPAVGTRLGVKAVTIYRPPNNPYVDQATRRIREACGVILQPRGPEAARTALGVLAEGGSIAMLVDQKRVGGRPVPLFGRDAPTASTPADLALRYDALIMPVRVERLAGARFRVTCLPPLDIPRTGDREADTRAILIGIHSMLESWIREAPAQWLWPHRRWDGRT